MKNIVYIVSFFSLFSCVNKKNIEVVKNDVKDNLGIIDNFFQKYTQKQFKLHISNYIKRGHRSKTDREKSLKVIEKTKEVKRKYLETIDLFDNYNSNQSINQENL